MLPKHNCDNRLYGSSNSTSLPLSTKDSNRLHDRAGVTLCIISAPPPARSRSNSRTRTIRLLLIPRTACSVFRTVIRWYITSTVRVLLKNVRTQLSCHFGALFSSKNKYVLADFNHDLWHSSLSNDRGVDITMLNLASDICP